MDANEELWKIVQDEPQEIVVPANMEALQAKLQFLRNENAELRKTLQDKDQEIEKQELRVVLPELAVRAQSALAIERGLGCTVLRNMKGRRGGLTCKFMRACPHTAVCLRARVASCCCLQQLGACF